MVVIVLRERGDGRAVTRGGKALVRVPGILGVEIWYGASRGIAKDLASVV
jgi:hypothetical protein